ncbi:hypothetical protein Leryth_026622 [Lithospermum erythrorhizon]|nr:hypothetical protein Leryth_026622 [Lithospermum erythrorhizon]
MIEGGELSDKVEKVTHEIKFVSTSDGGCSANSVTKFYTTEGANLSEDELQASKEGSLGLIKLVEPIS